jgi:hypothetical protein
MVNLFSFFSIKQFFHEIYTILADTDTKATEVWFEISEISFLKNLDKFELTDFLLNFDFVKLKKGNYNIDYVSIDKILFVMESIKILKLDLKLVAELLDYTGFEVLVNKILSKNNYKVLNNFRFSDKSNFKNKTSQKNMKLMLLV